MDWVPGVEHGGRVRGRVLKEEGLCEEKRSERGRSEYPRERNLSHKSVASEMYKLVLNGVCDLNGAELQRGVAPL